MNYMKQGAKMLGVEIGERFKIGENTERYHIQKDGIWLDNWDMSVHANYLLEVILNGDYKIIKQYWKPKIGNLYYYVDTMGGIALTANTKYYTSDIMRLRVGNCYKTEEEITPEIVLGWLTWYKGGKNPTE